MGPGFYTIVGMLLTLAIFLAHVIFKSGHTVARVESLEQWRINVRQDFHEVSEKLEELNGAVRHLATVIEERTDRRSAPRDHKPSGH